MKWLFLCEWKNVNSGWNRSVVEVATAALDFRENSAVGADIKLQQKVWENSQEVSSVGLDDRDCTQLFPQKSVCASPFSTPDLQLTWVINTQLIFG